MAEQIVDDSAYTEVRLPTCCVPTFYELSLTPNLNSFTFVGSVSVEYKSSKLTEKIVLHTNNLVIKDGYVTGKEPTSNVNLVKVVYSRASETASLFFSTTVPSEGKLCLKFSGILDDKLRGFYRTAFKTSQGETLYGLTSQCQSTDARQIFPCWDEPSIKARFSVTLTYSNEHKTPAGEDYTALSNTEVISREVIDGKWNVVKFAPTPIMSTYLLAFVVAPLDSITNYARPDLKVSVYLFPDKTEQGHFALDVACRTIKFFEDYFQIEFPLNKLDLVAVPDFAFGAMENWGLVIYREDCLQLDPINTSASSKQYIAIIVAHELAHQWFGNLVTLEWWTHLWLNEGFASFMQYLCVDHLFPEYDIWSQFLSDSYSRALDLDALNNSHPIEVPVAHPSEINEIFDIISYCKGASVIRMLHNYIGDECFRTGMHNYLTKYAYSNAKTEDLWQVLEEVSNKAVHKLMSCWTSQKGFPWLSVNYSQDGDKATLTITQNKFVANGQETEEDLKWLWVVPVSAITTSSPTTPASTTLLEGKTGRLSVVATENEWIKLNPASIGLYRTLYPEVLVKRLWPALSNKSLSAADRLGLLSDFFALCQAGKVSTVDLLKLVSVLAENEDDYTVWRLIDNCYARLSMVFANDVFASPPFATYGRNVVYVKIFEKLGWEPRDGEKHTDALTRALVINRLVAIGEGHIVEEALLRFRKHLDKSRTIPADLRAAVFRAVAMYGDEKTFDALFELHRDSNLSEEKDRVARAICYTKAPHRIGRVVDFAMSSEVRDQDKIFMFQSLGESTPLSAWKLLRKYKDVLREKYDGGLLLARVIKSCTQNLFYESYAKEVESFFESFKFAGSERAIQQSLEVIRVNVHLLKSANAVIEYCVRCPWKRLYTYEPVMM